MNSVGAVILATSAPGPRLTNHARSAAEIVPVAWPDRYADVMCGSRSRPAAAPYRTFDHPAFTIWALYRLVSSECHAMVGTITSTRQSMAAVTSWMPPPYEPPTMPTRGSVFASSCTFGWVATQSISSWTSCPSASALSVVMVPVDLPNPRGSQVRT